MPAVNDATNSEQKTSAALENMTEVQRQAQLLNWMTIDGPIPARLGREVLRTQGFDHRNRWRLQRAKQEAGVVSKRNGWGPGSAYYWLGERDLSPIPETPNTWASCTACGWSARLPASQLPRPCLHTPRCHGLYTAGQDTAIAMETRIPATGSAESRLVV